MPILLRIGMELCSAVSKAVTLQWRCESSRPDDVQCKCFWMCAVVGAFHTLLLEYVVLCGVTYPQV